LLTRIANSPFSLDQNSGELFLTGTLNYEERNSYTVSDRTCVCLCVIQVKLLLQLMFQVSDGVLTGNTSIIVAVVDENDNAPTFTNTESVI